MNKDGIPWEVVAPARRLFLAHLRGEASALELFGHGSDHAARVDAVRRRRDTPLPHREALAAAVVAYQEILDGAPPAAVDEARRLAHPDAVVVIAGQQPGVGGGPMLGFVKALGVLAMARSLEQATGGPVIPVWWVASEDHDLDEAGAVLLHGGAPGSALLSGAPRDRTMLSHVNAPAIEFPEVEFAAEAERVFRSSPGASLGTASAETFARLLGQRGLVVVEPHVVRTFAVGLFEQDVREPGRLAEAVTAGNAAIREAGFENSLPDPEGPLHFTVDGEGRRTRGGGTVDHLDDPATRLSADVALRVLAQDAAFPVAIQVAGPSEAEYLAALGPAREASGIFRPVVAGRPGVTLLEPRLEESLRTFGTDVAGVLARGEEALSAPDGEDDGDRALATEARRLGDDLRTTVEGLERLPAAVRKRAEKAGRALDDLAAAADRAREEARGVGATRRRKILQELLPAGAPQERRWSLLRYVLQHGIGIVDPMADAVGDGEPMHHVVRLGSR